MKKVFLLIIACASILTGCDDVVLDNRKSYIGEWRMSIPYYITMFSEKTGEISHAEPIGGDELVMIIYKDGSRLKIKTPFGDMSGDVGIDGFLHIDDYVDSVMYYPNTEYCTTYTHDHFTKIKNHQMSWRMHIHRIEHLKDDTYFGELHFQVDARKLF